MGPTVVSHYRLLDRLGEGGMGVVYRAEDLRLGREVAVKLLRTDPNTPSEWLARFEREARLASSLQHAHICTIHELGEHEGQPFIAMERLEGETVRQLIEAGRIPIYRVLHFARQIAEALDAAADRGIEDLLIGGGVAANSRLRALAVERAEARGVRVRVPRPGLCTDNGAMVAALGAQMVARGVAPSTLDLPADSSMPVTLVRA